ncbi:acylase [Rugamonas sp. DEMB1]|uniref:acylase n=1 Tax=Rugamonas sp. DEMB1 TaxID=3039386 RepID=UPI002447E792|nr:acylase [Rugamonas sp. DEMB1]WGG52502.1 acylase [Rugamonas sp. DEMB1]
MTFPASPVFPSRRLGAAGLASLALALAAGCSGGGNNSGSASDGQIGPPPPAPVYAAEIRRTGFGVPHIKAGDEAGLGYGIGYAYAEDNICLLAGHIATVNGERAKYFGAAGATGMTGAANVQSDFYFRLVNDADAVAVALKAQPAEILALLKGYVAGYNRYLEQTGAANLADECKGQPWVRKLAEADMVKLVRGYAAFGGVGQFVEAINGTQPGGPLLRAGVRASGPIGPPPAPPQEVARNPMTPEYWTRLHARSGSNAVALGRDGSDNGQGLLLGNSHFPWSGPLRFYQMHLTIPGKLDVMGASLAGLPLVNIGFNQNLAWGHTVNTSAHFTVFQLQLDPADPTKYLVDGKSRSMLRKRLSIDVLGADGVLRSESRELYVSDFGNLVQIPGMLEWKNGVAYAVRDANLDNHRMMEQWYAINRAGSAAELKSAVLRLNGLPWVNTLAADKDGNALFLDVTVVPNVSSAQQASCVPAPYKALAAYGLFVLDGSKAACDWALDPAAAQPGIFAAAKLPALSRGDFVQNSNDSAWFSHPEQPLVGFPAIVSVEGIALSGRARLGISQLQARLAGSDGLAGKRMSMAQMQDMVLNNRVYHAEHTVDDLLRLCAVDKSGRADDGSTVDLTQACAKLAAWDRHANLDANLGLVYFAGMWDRIGGDDSVWALPFDPADPLRTPRGLKVADASVAATVRAALASSVRDANRQGWAAGSTWGSIQVAKRGGRNIPIHGAADRYGVYNAIGSAPDGKGLLDVTEGTSYLQVVGFDKNGPQAQAVLSYSQSTHAKSPYFADQTERFSQKAWITQAYTEAQITADPAYSSKKIAE